MKFVPVSGKNQLTSVFVMVKLVNISLQHKVSNPVKYVLHSPQLIFPIHIVLAYYILMHCVAVFVTPSAAGADRLLCPAVRRPGSGGPGQRPGRAGEHQQ